MAAETAAPLFDVTVKLVPELLRVARDAPDREIAECAERLALDSVADVDEEIEVVLRSVSSLDLLQQLDEPARPLPAGRALAARLVHVELLRSQGELHHAGALVDDDDRRG